MGDQFRCRSWRDGIADLQFLGRAGVISDLVGEKLSDAFVAEVLAPLPMGASLVPVREPKPHYQLWIDATEPLTPEVTASIEQRLTANPQYAYARELGQLRDLEVVYAPGFPQYRARLLAAQGGRLGDAKSCALILDRNQLPVD
jgi:hypothetical protein